MSRTAGMRTIWKYPLDIVGDQQVMMPEGARILSVANQGGELCVWAEVDSGCVLEARSIYIVGTGNPMSRHDNEVFIGTALVNEFVWHVYVAPSIRSRT